MNTSVPLPDDIDTDGLADRYLAAQRTNTIGAINYGLDQNPDDAAEADRLSQVTGDNPSWVADNLDEYKADLKRRTAKELVLNNPALVDYVQSHPLASAISNDDWAALDKFTEQSSGSSLQKFHEMLNAPFEKTAEGIIEGAESGWQGGSILTPEMQQAMNPRENKLGALGAGASTLVYGGADLLSRTFQSLMGAATEGPAGALQTGGFMDAPEAHRVVESVFNEEMAKGGAHEPGMGEYAVGLKPVDLKPATGAQLAKPWTDAGMLPPPGLHPEIDKVLAQANSSWLDAIEKDLANMATSATRERSPDAAGWFTSREYGDTQMGLHADAALALYPEGKIPEPNDGILGWVPDIEKQLEAARETNSDVNISVKDWLAKVDPTVATNLRPDIRMWPGAITEREATELPTAPKDVITEPLPELRASLGAEPKFAMGDRKLTLQAMGIEPGDQFLPEVHKWQFNDENGKAVGDMEIIPGPDKKTLYVNWIGGQAGLHANTFGPALMRDLKRQIKEAYPDYTQITGHRVSGARERANDFGPMPVPKVSLDEVPKEAGSEAGLEPLTPVKLDGEHTEEDHKNLQTIFAHSYVNGKHELEDITRKQYPQPRTSLDFSSWRDGLYRPGETFGTAGRIDYETPGMVPEWFHRVNDSLMEIAKRLGMDDVPKVWVGDSTKGLDHGGSYFPGGWNTIVINRGLSETEALHTGLHEMGHALEYDKFTKAPEETRIAIKKAWMRDQVQGYTVEQARPITGNRYPENAKKSRANLDYTLNFSEWFAEQVSRWITTKKEPTGVVEKFFQGIASVWKSIYAKVTGYQPIAASVDEFMKGLWRKDAEFRREQGARPTEGAGGGGAKLPPSGTGTPIEPPEPPKRAPRTPVPEGIKNLGPLTEPPTGDVMLARAAMEAGSEPGADPIVEGLQNLVAKSVGLPGHAWQMIREKIIAQQKSDIAEAYTRAKKIQDQKQSKAWNDNRIEMAKNVAAEIRQRPDVAADLFLGSGELLGKKTKQRYTLAEDDLSDDEKAMLPAHYVSKNGLPPDAVASMFGYGSRGDMIQGLAKLEQAKIGADGKRLQPIDFMRRLVQAETDRRMEVKYGSKEQMAVDAARDQALSESQLNVQYEELRAVAEKAGVTIFDKHVIMDAAKRLVDETTVEKINSFRMSQSAGQISRKANEALATEDLATAAVHMQKHMVASAVASEMRKVEKEIASFDKLAARMAKREIWSLPPASQNWIQKVLTQIEKKVRRTPEEIQRELDALGHDTIEDFQADRDQFGHPIYVADQIKDPNWTKPYKTLTVPEFRDIRDTIRSMVEGGRNDKTVLKAGEKMDMDDARVELMKGLERVGDPSEFNLEGPAKKPGFLAKAYPRLIQSEFLMNRLTNYNWLGAWHQMYVRPLMEGEDLFMNWQKTMAGFFNEIQSRPDLKKTLSNTIFRDPISGQFPTMTKENLRTVMVQMGSESSFDKLVHGWSIPEMGHQVTREGVEAWVDTHADEGDWKFVEGVWRALEFPREKSTEMMRNIGRIPMKWVEGREVQTPFGVKKGGYYPVMWHDTFEGKSAKASGIPKDGVFRDGYSTGMLPSAGYQISRKDYAAPTSMTFDGLVGRINQQLWDASMRPGIINAGKILRDPAIRNEIKSRLGTEWYNTMRDHLISVANRQNIGATQTGLAKAVASKLKFIQQNAIFTMVAFNVGTVAKHAPTAAFLSANQVGPRDFAHAAKLLFQTNEETGEKWNKFVWDNSLEIQGRDRNIHESIYGATEDSQGKKTPYMSLREQMHAYGSKPVALSDLASAKPTWLAAYLKAIEGRGIEKMDHGDAVQYANYNVRQAHGSTRSVARPQMMNELHPLFTSLLTFFSDVFNRTNETLWKAGDMLGAVRSGDMPEAAKIAPGVLAGIFTSMIIPAVIEQLVSPAHREKDESDLHYGVKVATHTLFAGIPVLREMVEYLMGGSSPQAGIIGTEMELFGKLFKDFQKNQPLSPAHAQQMIRDAAGTVGITTGLTSNPMGNVVAFPYGVAHGTEHPHGPWGWLKGLRYGTLKGHGQ